ncbi:hypothetical protein M404DRAFT_620322 [Pisolithus tinctorius Marx 270]|uniref:Uncharacterized protein n=1 Tax=Pisolithus tinctorius Marx 270 TaxID=870435 RepID=A0A0C3K1M6_PISTI|nr:hypothetical protein M404DRAFT_620322 [Pisolithus tinctorius Marx 270]
MKKHVTTDVLTPPLGASSPSTLQTRHWAQHQETTEREHHPSLYPLSSESQSLKDNAADRTFRSLSAPQNRLL